MVFRGRGRANARRSGAEDIVPHFEKPERPEKKIDIRNFLGARGKANLAREPAALRQRARQISEGGQSISSRTFPAIEQLLLSRPMAEWNECL